MKLFILPILLILGCSGQPIQAPMVCPIPSELLARLPPPATAAEAIEATRVTVEQVKEVVADPTLSGAILAANRALDIAEPLCPTLDTVAKVDCQGKVDEARATLAKADVTRGQVCSAAKLAVVLAQIADDSVELVALDEACR